MAWLISRCRLAPGDGPPYYTPMGYMSMTTEHPKILTRLSRIEGQVRGIARMVEEDRYCIDILNQMQAIKAALKKVEEEILKGHASHCVAHAIKSGNIKDQTEKFSELVELFSRYGK
jgi:CsoR family transcriptional regulator, copper-sensing transcriptional repressor